MHSFLTHLDQQISDLHLLKHPFYLAWSKGELSLEVLQEYAKEYYHHVKAFPTYLSALHAHTECAETRKLLLQNLIEEEAGAPNHPELWRAFAKGLGVTDRELDAHLPCQEIVSLISTFRSITKNESVAAGIAALYAYESQIPEICHSKIDGLKRHYGMTKPEDFRYFSVHIGADEEHARVERELLQKHVTAENQATTLQAADQVLQKLWNFLSGLCERHQIACAM